MPFVFSASSESSLTELVRRYLHFCKANQGIITQPRDLAWTLHTRRSTLPYRVAIPASNIDDLSSKLEDLLRSIVQPNSAVIQRFLDKPHQAPRVWGIFTGQGAQWSRMGARLVEASDLARGYITRLDEILANLPAFNRPSWTLHDEILSLASPQNSRVSSESPSVAQPVCTAIQILLVNLLRLAGVKLHCVIGHSSGEIGAAYASGLISEEEAIRAAYYRGKLVQEGSKRGRGGAMLAVHTTLEEVEALGELEIFHGRVQMAAHNSPSTVVLSGDEEAIEGVAEFFRGRRTVAQRLEVNTAYHSHHMLPYAEPYAAALEGMKVEEPKDDRPVWYSSSTIPSVKMTPQNLASRYWAVNMTSPVHFFETVAHVLEADGAPDIVLEIGPHPALRSAFTSTFKSITGIKNTPPYHGLLSRGQDDIHQFSSALGEVWRHLGVNAVDFDALDRAFSGNTEKKWLVKGLPQYPFDHSRSFGGSLSRVSSAHIHGHAAPHPLLGRRCFELETTHEVTWRNVLRPVEIPWLSGHQLQGQLVFPATASLAMAINSIMLLAGDKIPHLITLEDVVIERAIVFSDEEASVETLFTVKFDSSNPTEGTLAAEFACYSNLSNDAPMVRNVSGRITAELKDNNMEPLQNIPKESFNLREVTASRFYASLTKLGYEYQTPFNGIRSIRRKLGYATGKIHTDSTSRWAEGQQVFLVHPGMMDSALQTISAAASCPGDGLTYTMNVPTKIDRLVLNPKHAASAAKVVEYTSLIRELYRGETTADVYLATPAETFMQIEGVHIKPLSPPSAEDDEVMFSEFVYGPYELNSAVAMASEGVSPSDERSAAWACMAQLARQLAHRYPRMRILEVGEQSHHNPIPPRTRSPS